METQCDDNQSNKSDDSIEILESNTIPGPSNIVSPKHESNPVRHSQTTTTGGKDVKPSKTEPTDAVGKTSSQLVKLEKKDENPSIEKGHFAVPSSSVKLLSPQTVKFEQKVPERNEDRAENLQSKRETSNQ